MASESRWLRLQPNDFDRAFIVFITGNNSPLLDHYSCVNAIAFTAQAFAEGLLIMEILDHCRTKGEGAQRESRSGLFGLIGDKDFYRPELHGFEVDMNGRVIVPDFHPNSDSVIRKDAA